MASTRRRGAHAAAAPDTASPPATRVSGLRARLSPVRVVVAVLVLGFGTMVLTGGLWSSPSAEPAVQQFLLDWQQHSYAAAAALTTGNASTVTTGLANAYSGLDAAAFYLNMGTIRQSGGTATAHFTASVDLGQDGAPWMYTGNLTLRRVGPSWKIVWSPRVINPGLSRGLRLAVISTALRSRPITGPGSKGEIVTAVRDHLWPLIAAGSVRPVVEVVLPLARAGDAHRRMAEGGHFGKIVLTTG